MKRIHEVHAMPSIPSLVAASVAVIAASVVAGRFFPTPIARSLAALDRRRCGLTLKHRAVMGYDLPYLEAGVGEPLILIHGIGGQKENFSGVARYLRTDCRVILPDLLGFGGAPRDPSADYSINAQAERIMAFASSLGLHRMHLGGNSMGAFIAAECAARYPDRVASLWLIGAAGLRGPQETEIMRQFRATREWPLLVHTPSEFERLLHTVMVHPPFMPYPVKRILGERASADCQLHRRIAQQVLLTSSPLNERHGNLQTPTLIMWGSEDKVLHPSAIQPFQVLFTNSRVAVLQGAGHAAMMEAPREAATSYRQFRSNLSSSPATASLAPAIS